MKIDLSWSAYGSGVAGLSVIYYGYVAFRYYRSELLHPQRRRQVPEERPAYPSPSSPPIKETHPDPQTMVHELVDELKALLSQANLEGFDKERLTVALKGLLSKYPILYTSKFKQDILHFVRMESENECGIHFNAEELVQLWTP